jgi:hypothetical protein
MDSPKMTLTPLDPVQRSVQLTAAPLRLEQPDVGGSAALKPELPVMAVVPAEKAPTPTPPVDAGAVMPPMPADPAVPMEVTGVSE